jgi:YfiH family protein
MTLPPVPDAFAWIDAPWGGALQCRPLAAVAPHLFTTRQLALTDEGYGEIARVLGAGRVATATQVHRADVLVVGAGMLPTRAEADALISNHAATAVVVRAADCVPLLMADRRRGVVAAVHAGWRGTVARITGTALAALAREFGTRSADVVAAIGPAIGACCYEVGPDVVDAFAAAGHERHLVERWVTTPSDRAFAPASTTRSLRLDVAGANRDQLLLAGVPDDQIHVAGLCTAMHLDVLTSYRAEKERATRIAGAIRAAG